MAEISDVVRATGSVATGAGGDRADFGNYLFLTGDTTQPNTGDDRILQASALADLADFGTADLTFPETSDPYRAASAWFTQDPYPRGSFFIARWVTANVNSVLTGMTPAAASDILALGSTSVDVAVTTRAGVDQTGTISVDFSSQTTYGDQAAALQTGLRASATATALNNVEVAFDTAGNRFVVTIPYADGDFTGPIAGAAGDELGLDTGTFTAGIAAQGANDALNEIEMDLPDYTFIGGDSVMAGTQTVVEALSTQAAARGKQLMMDLTGDTALDTNDATSLPAVIANRQSRYDCLVWKGTIDYTAVSTAARFSAVNWTGYNTLPDGKFIRCPGRTIDNLTDAQRAELTRKRLNYFTNFGRRNLIAEGQTCAPGYWLDTQIFLLWFVNAVESDVFGAIADAVSARMTPAGINIARDAARGVCDEAVRNGGFSKGRRITNTAIIDEIKQATGNEGFDGTMTAGYLIHIDPIEDLSAQDRATRTMPEMRIWGAGSGAIHFANIAATFVE